MICEFDRHDGIATCVVCQRAVTVVAVAPGPIVRNCVGPRSRPRPAEAAQFQQPSQRPIGVGTLLSRQLAACGFADAAGCRCRSLATQMDAMGPEWCRANVDYLVGQLRIEFERRRSAGELHGVWRLAPWINIVARRVVLQSIRAAERQPSTNASIASSRAS